MPLSRQKSPRFIVKTRPDPNGLAVAIPWGALTRDQYVTALENERENLPKDSKPLGQTFQLLDNEQAQCIETWPTKDASVTFQRWTFLVKRRSAWKVLSIRQGKEWTGLGE
jgi:hypothetical protein